MEIRPTSAKGILLGESILHASLEEVFTPHLPWPVGLVEVAEGARVLCNLMQDNIKPGTELTLFLKDDPTGRSTYFASAKEP